MLLEKLVSCDDSSFPENVFLLHDFETGSYNSAVDVFSSYFKLVVSGCWFHFVSAIYKKVCALGLQTEYLQHCSFFYAMNCVFFLPYIPVSDVSSTFKNIYTVYNLAPELIKYLKNT